LSILIPLSLFFQTPIHYSNVRLVDPVTKQPVRVGWRFLEDGAKVRVTKGGKASGSVIPRPEVLAQRRVPRPLPGPSDTPAGVAARVTVSEGDKPSLLPAMPDFKGGVGRRAFSSGAGGSGGGSALLPASVRAWVGFAAGGVRR